MLSSRVHLPLRLARACASSRSMSTPLPPTFRDDGYETQSCSVLHSRYLTVYERTVMHPESRESFSYDVVGHPRASFHSVHVLVAHLRTSSSSSPTFFFVREYGQGPNTLIWSLPAGGFDERKHSSLEAAAQAELSEECELSGGELLRLLPHTHPGLLESKWCANRFTPFLCIDPGAAASPGARDPEEEGLVVHRLTQAEVEEALYGGDMLPPAILTWHLGLAELRRRGVAV
jgi:8-oxo-dGTP pyrophosphatase MutT (NUDIX family)